MPGMSSFPSCAELYSYYSAMYVMLKSLIFYFIQVSSCGEHSKDVRGDNEQVAGPSSAQGTDDYSSKPAADAKTAQSFSSDSEADASDNIAIRTVSSTMVSLNNLLRV